MKKISKVVFAIALVGAMALVLAACGGSDSGSGSAASAGAASSDVSKDTFVVTKVTFYGEDGTVGEVDTYERDEHGNTVQITSQRDLESDDTKSVVKYGLDENGYTVSLTQPDGQKVTYETTFDGDKPLKVVGTNGSTMDYQYHDNGILSEIASQFGDEFKSVSTYDEGGYLIEKDVTFGNGDSKKEAVMAYAWEFDGSNNPVSVTLTEPKANEDASVGGLPVGTYAIECDADGNIVKIAKAESGDVVVEREYVKVDNPSASCKLNSALQSV